MTREEFSKLVKAMKAIYADPKFIADQYAFDVWYMVLGSLDYKTATVAVQKYMSLGTRPPLPADILAQAKTLDASKDTMTEQEAWNEVYKCVTGLDWTNPQRKYDMMPELCRKIITLEMILSWAKGDEMEFQTVIRSAFRRSYEEAVKGVKDDAQLPRTLRMCIAEMRSQTALLEDRYDGIDYHEE